MDTSLPENIVLMPGVGRTPKQLLELALKNADQLKTVLLVLDWDEDVQVTWSSTKTSRLCFLCKCVEGEVLTEMMRRANDEGRYPTDLETSLND